MLQLGWGGPEPKCWCNNWTGFHQVHLRHKCSSNHLHSDHISLMSPLLTHTHTHTTWCNISVHILFVNLLLEISWSCDSVDNVLSFSLSWFSKVYVVQRHSICVQIYSMNMRKNWRIYFTQVFPYLHLFIPLFNNLMSVRANIIGYFETYWWPDAYNMLLIYSIVNQSAPLQWVSNLDHLLQVLIFKIISLSRSIKGVLMRVYNRSWKYLGQSHLSCKI